MKQQTGVVAVQAQTTRPFCAGAAPKAALGRLSLLLCFSLLAVGAPAQLYYQGLWSFGPTSSSGSFPRAPLLEASDGRLYGTTYGGGSNDLGCVFSLSKNGTGFNVIYSLSNAYFPSGGLAEATNGTLCGTTSSGDSNSGTVFKLNKDGSGFGLLHAFPAFSGDGSQPSSGLIRGANGVLYGTTGAGGSLGSGTVFSLLPDGSGYAVLHSFGGASNGGDGSSPASGLCLGADGALYGTTTSGGSNNLGTVFKLAANGTGYQVLHHFSGAPADGRLAYGGLVQGKDGRLYGTTYYGGANDLGTVFSLGTNGGSYTVLTSFAGGNLGNQPFAGVVQGPGGQLYGTTRYGGSQDGGTVFTLSTNGSGYAVLHSFTGTGAEGSQPLTALLAASDEALYGSTYWGGAYATNSVSGTLFKLAKPMPPTIESQCCEAGHFQLCFSGPTGQPYTVLASTNPSLAPGQWTVVTNGTFSGAVTFTDTNKATMPARFYRLRSP